MSFPRYESYCDSGAEWLGEVPNHWDMVRLAALFREVNEPGNNDLPVLSVSIHDGVSDEEIDPDIVDRKIMRSDDRTKYKRVEPNDLVYNMMRAWQGGFGTVRVTGSVSPAYVVARPLRSEPTAFLEHVLRTPMAVEEMRRRSRGVTDFRLRLYWDEFKTMVVALPPLPERQKILTFIAEESAKIDALVEEQQRLIKLLKEKRQAVISHAVTKGLDPSVPMKASGVEWLDEVPAHWEVVRLAALFREANEPGNNDLPVLSVSIHEGVSDEELDPDVADRKITRSDDRTKYKRVEPNDLVYNMMRAWQGGFGTVRVTGSVSPAYVVARPLRSGPTEFLEHVLRTPMAVEEMRRHSRGVTDFRLRLYWDEFKSMVVALPPLPERQNILNCIAAEAARFDRFTEEASAAISLLQERRAALISAAVTGKIDVRGLAEGHAGEEAA